MHNGNERADFLVHAWGGKRLRPSVLGFGGPDMNMNDIAKEVARLEGGKKQLSIAQIKEVLRCLSDMAADNKEVLDALYTYAIKRAMRK